MKKLNLILSVSMLFCTVQSFSQYDFSSITVILLDDMKAPVAGQSFTLFQGEDSLTTKITDENGEFRVDSVLRETEYFIYDNALGKNYHPLPHKILTESYQQDYILTITNPSYRKEHEPVAMYFEKDEVEASDNSEAALIAALLKEHPTLGLEFSHAVGYNESHEILNERRDNFLKLLEENGVKMSSIRFSDEIHTLSETFEDRRSRIEGAVYSMDSNCN